MHISVELTFLKGLMSIRQANPKTAILVHMSMNLSYIAILNTKGSDYRCIISGISKKEGINLMQNTDLTRKSRTS